MEQTKEIEKIDRHPFQKRAAERLANIESERLKRDSEKTGEKLEYKNVIEVKSDLNVDPDDAFMIRLVLDVVAGRSERALFDEAGDLKEGCQSSALLAVAEGLMQSFNRDLSVKDGLMLKLSLTAMSACGYYPDIKEIPAENPHPEKIPLDDSLKAESEWNQSEIEKTDLDTDEITPEEPNE